MSGNLDQPETKLAEREDDESNPAEERRGSEELKRRVRLSMENQVMTLPSVDEETEEEGEKEGEEAGDEELASELDIPQFEDEEPDLDDLEHLFDAESQGGSAEGKPRKLPSDDMSAGSLQFLVQKRQRDSTNISDRFFGSIGGASFEELSMMSGRGPEDYAGEPKKSIVSAKDTSFDVPSTSSSEEDDRTDISIDRALYCQMYDMFTEKKRIELMKNNILQNKMASYYLRRKMYYVLKEPPQFREAKAMYEHHLDLLGDLVESSDRERELLEDEVASLRAKHAAKVVELDALFDRLQQAEQDFGRTLTFERTGRENMDKLVERFLKRQRSQTNMLAKLRLCYFKLRSKFNETNRALDALDHLGPGFRIMDYVQLKLDNRNLHDRLEEKDTEMTKLRELCRNAAQVLAHNREKASVLNMDVEKKREDLESVETDLFDAREQLGYLKSERDSLRVQIKALKLEYGLLTHPNLIRDMENSIKEIKEMEIEIEKHKIACEETTRKTIAVRKNMEAFVHLKRKEETKRLYPELVSLDSSSSEDNTKSIVVKQLSKTN